MLTTAAPSTTSPPSSPDDERGRHALGQLRLLLQLAYSGELAAIRAYLGQRHSIRDRVERAELRKIIRDEVRHRHCLLD